MAEPTWQKKLDNLIRLAHHSYFGTKNRILLISTLEKIKSELVKNESKLVMMSIDEHGHRTINGMPDYEYLKIEALNRIAVNLEPREYTTNSGNSCKVDTDLGVFVNNASGGDGNIQHEGEWKRRR